MENILTKHKTNDWLKIIAVAILPFLIMGLIWIVWQYPIIENLKSETKENKQENKKISEQIIDIKIAQAQMWVKLENIEKLLVEIKNDLKGKK